MSGGDESGSDGSGNATESDADFDPIAFLEAAVSTPSHGDVGAMRNLLVETLEGRGVPTRVDDAGNVLATRGADADWGTRGADADWGTRGVEGGTHVVLNTHLDTVTPHVPFERDDVTGRDDAGSDDVTGRDAAAGPDDAAASEGSAGVIRGRGSCDAKGPLAALLVAFFGIGVTGDRESDAPGRVTLAITPDEETRSTGAHALASDPESPVRDADAVIVGEPTGLDVCTAARGRFQGTIALEGANAHAAEPAAGVNAVAALEPVLNAITSFDRSRGPAAHPDLGPPTLTPTVVEGGDAPNQVPADCRLTFDRRSVPPETADGFRDALSDHLQAAAPADVAVDVSLADRPTPFLEAWATDADVPVVRELVDADGAGTVRPFTAATEASYFAAHVPTVVFGPGVLADEEGAVAHGPREYVRVGDVRAAATALERALESLVG